MATRTITYETSITEPNATNDLISILKAILKVNQLIPIKKIQFERTGDPGPIFVYTLNQDTVKLLSQTINYTDPADPIINAIAVVGDWKFSEVALVAIIRNALSAPVIGGSGLKKFIYE